MGYRYRLAILSEVFFIQFYFFLLAIYVANNALIGNYNLAQNFLVLITFVTSPINTMLFPAFSKFDGDTEQTTLENVYQSSVKYSTLLVMPVIAAMMALAGPVFQPYLGTAMLKPILRVTTCH